MEEITKMHVDWKKITVVGALVILTAITIGGLTWYVATSGSQAEMEAYKNDIVRLETEIKQLQAEEAPTDETAATEESTYTNTEYKFSLVFPATWDGYTVVKRADAATGVQAYYDVNLTTTNADWIAQQGSNKASMFALGVYTEEEWATVQAQEGPKPTLVGTSGANKIGYMTAQDAPSDLVSKSSDIKDIIASFKAL